MVFLIYAVADSPKRRDSSSSAQESAQVRIIDIKQHMYIGGQRMVCLTFITPIILLYLLLLYECVLYVHGM